ncbi:type I polyketide synthase [Paracoccus nototheniae]|uniref:SDR family NAD(P)-dependent oxidoreductase n=1 Tax=Paracoccus nototheniae TaxID=2489002 RepID=A0ABW4DXZ6_9RHOB|nr:type I polyketide synthase [Paracoccus nototheniae]
MSGIPASTRDIAIVGFGLDLPGAADPGAYWANLRAGIESIRDLSPDDLRVAGESEARTGHPDYVARASLLDGFDQFDAEFFGFSPKDAAVMDPQHRKFLETCWHAIEHSGHRADDLGAVGVWAGCGMGTYFSVNICSNRDLVEETGMFLLRHTGNDKDFLSTRVSYTFDLRGPSVSVQTACSTSLVAVHAACQALIAGDCDAALAGGVTIELPQGRGYLYKPNEILSPDGHCRAFDHRSEGTVFGSGAAVVMLRRLSDALADGDHIWAVIRGSAINNDGSAKAGYLAPSVEGQAAAIAEAHLLAGVDAATIDYVECHGTGTRLGDPIEVAALTEAFSMGSGGGRTGLGSVKTNIGHLDTAAGTAGLIKVALSLHHGEIPPSLNFEAPNPVIDFDDTPFHVVAARTPWPATPGRPARAAVNSLGVGGTNAHVVLEAAPARAAAAETDWPVQPLVISGRTRAALDANAAALAGWLRDNPDADLADVGFTLQQGRKTFDKRRVLVAADATEAADLLERADPRRVFTHDRGAGAPKLAFLFPGGGAQSIHMARGLYDTEPVFRDWMDRGLAVLERLTGRDPRAIWLPEPGAEDQAAQALNRPSVQLPLIMIVEYALAQLWISWGAQPQALAGHSMGENTAACLAGVIGFDDCIALVELRGRLFDTVAPGGMLSVPLPVDELLAEAGEGLDLAADNAPGLSVVSGPRDRIDALQARLAARGIDCARIAIDIAAHSRMLDPILPQFEAFLRSIPLQAPRIPLLSNRSGDWMTDAQATDPRYWVDHLRHSVDFRGCIATLRADPDRLFLEVGPGRAMSALAQANGAAPDRVVSSLRHPDQVIGDDAFFLMAFARLWAAGLPLNWTPIWGEGRRRVPLPGYVFQTRRYFIEPAAAGTAAAADDSTPLRLPDSDAWGWRPAWRLSAPDVELDDHGQPLGTPERWLVLADDSGLGNAVITRLRRAGHSVVTLRPGDRFAQTSDDEFTLAPENGAADFELLIAALVAQNRLPQRIVSFWLVPDAGREGARAGFSPFHRHLEQGFNTALHLIRALAGEGGGAPVDLVVVTSDAVRTGSEPVRSPEKAMVLGPLAVGMREFPWLTARSIDVAMASDMAGLAPRLIEDLLDPTPPARAAWRSGRRLARHLVPAALPAPAGLPAFADGVVLITGGLGGIALTLARHIADQGAAVALLSRRPLPPEDEWDARIAADPDHRQARQMLALRALRASGARIVVEAADVTDAAALTQAVARIRAQLGPVTDLIHAAGVVADAPMQAKSSAEIEDVLAPKVHGTRNLALVFADAPLRRTVLFASTSTEIAATGQVDYVAANEYLNAVAGAGIAALGQVTSVNWGVWAQIGMAAEALSGRRDLAPPVPVTQPLLIARSERDGAMRFTGRLSADDWIIAEHRTRDGVALLPGTGMIELAAQALQAAGRDGSPWALRDLTFLNPLIVAPGETRNFQISLTPHEGGTAFLLEADFGAGPVPVAEAQIALAGRPGPTPDLAALRARMRVDQAPTGHALESAQEGQLAFGPRWRVLRATWLSRPGAAPEGLAELSLSKDGLADLEQGYLLHPALMDIATGWAMSLIDGYDRAQLWVPLSYRALSVHAPLGAAIVSHVRLSHAADGYASFDVTLTDRQGAVLVEVEGLTLRRLDGAPAMQLTAALPGGQRAVDHPGHHPGQDRLARMVAQGIPPDLGPGLLDRALRAGLGQIAISSMDLPQLIAQETRNSRAREAGAATAFERPEMDHDFIEPRNDLERSLAGFFRELLGVQQVGVEDGFFDLGGHSLIAVRLFAMIRKAYGLDLPLATLFEAPTVAALAAMIERRIGPRVEGSATPATAPRQIAEGFTHLIPMSQGATGGGRPLFIVAGMFGNVLNLRALAQRISPDRPVWGLQAQGLFGDTPPHATLAEAAASCIAEIRQIQPDGPYLIAGFSGGGLTALEIARQLRDADQVTARLIMLDTPVPERPHLTRRDRLMIRLAEIRQEGPAFAARWLRDKLAYRRAQRRAIPDAGTTGFHNAAIHAAFLGALPQYRMEIWPGPVTLYRPRLDRRFRVSGGMHVSAAREYVFEDNLWSPWMPDLTVTEVPGDHDSMVLEPCVRVLAARMRDELSAADRADPAMLPRAAE